MLDDLMVKHGFHSNNIYNADETGINLSRPRSRESACSNRSTKSENSYKKRKRVDK